jgi:small subunit ribosomal protein S6
MAETTRAETSRAEASSVVNQYEGMFLLPGTAGADVEAATKLVRGIIEKHAGKVQVIKKWDERKLAYELERQKRGLYIIAFFKAPSSSISGIERDVSLSDVVVRVLITRAEHLNEEEMAAVEPQPILPREERNPWDRPDTRSFDRPRDDRPPRDDRGPRDDRPPRRRDEVPMGKD